MIKSTRAIWTIMLVLVLLLMTGCSDSGEGGDYPIEHIDEDPDSPRDFLISDQFPYPGKKTDCTVLDKPPNFTYSIYIYIINVGENWKKNDVRNISVTYYDNTSPGVKIEYDQFSVLEYNNLTYIRVDNVNYPQDARGYFRVTGEIEQGNNHWYPRHALSNLFNYGDPGDIPLPINRDYILYEKEYVD